MSESELAARIEWEREKLSQMVIQLQEAGTSLCDMDIVAQSRKLDDLLNQLADLRKKTKSHCPR